MSIINNKGQTDDYLRRWHCTGSKYQCFPDNLAKGHNGASMAYLIAQLATDLEHLGLNPGGAMSEGCFIFHFALLHLKVPRPT